MSFSTKSAQGIKARFPLPAEAPTFTLGPKESLKCCLNSFLIK